MSNLELYKVFSEAKKGINMKENTKAILDLNLPYFCYLFALGVPGSNKQELSEAVLKSLDIEVIYMFYRNIDFDKSEYDKYLLFM